MSNFDFDAAIRRMADLQEKIQTDESNISSVVTRIKTLKSAFKKLDEEVRTSALSDFRDYGDKKPHQEVWITIRKIRKFITPEKAVLEKNPKYLRIKEGKHEEAMAVLIQLYPFLVEADIPKITSDFQKGSSPFTYTNEDVPVVNISTRLGEYALFDSSPDRNPDYDPPRRNRQDKESD